MTGYVPARQQIRTRPAERAAPGPRPGAPRIAALGGGQGLSASLSALRRLTTELTAVVTVADDGGSSGRLRAELGVLPPGDLRKALAALCGDDDWGRTWSEVIQQRFTGNGELGGHAVGNLLIVALWEKLGDPVEALNWVGRLLNVQGRVLPMSAVPLDIEAQVRGHDPLKPGEVSAVRGQAAVAVTPGTVLSIRLLPDEPPAVPDAVQAVREADWVVLGPGSWFTSVLPHLLVPDLAKALVETRARRLLTLNLAPQPGETEGFTPQRHLEVIADHAPDLAVDAILVDERAVSGGAFGLADLTGLEQAAKRMGAALVLDQVARADGTPRHDPELLAAAYDRIFRTHGRIGPWR
ncbi:uridine diphosphate-N-acetylglucosamine-binding protein YvcK [Kitasatospora sp. NPDC051984]|uniref:uridine diphosphate-N-acetylglucosamine-binding protein YvcK n=1 Tax=Kitasatospora sp. NPDC051984 TaxID=3364059 RepID=UPI0037C50094